MHEGGVDYGHRASAALPCGQAHTQGLNFKSSVATSPAGGAHNLYTMLHANGGALKRAQIRCYTPVAEHSNVMTDLTSVLPLLTLQLAVCFSLLRALRLRTGLSQAQKGKQEERKPPALHTCAGRAVSTYAKHFTHAEHKRQTNAKHLNY